MCKNKNKHSGGVSCSACNNFIFALFAHNHKHLQGHSNGYYFFLYSTHHPPQANPLPSLQSPFWICSEPRNFIVINFYGS